MKILLLVLLILLSIASHILVQYLSYDYKASFSYIYTYFFGTLFVMAFSFWSFVSVGIYAYVLNSSKKSTSFEKFLAKIVLGVVAIISVIYIGNYFGLDIGFVGILDSRNPYQK